MRIAVISPHLPSSALPMRGVRHSEQLRLFAEAGHEVRAVVPIAWSPRRRATHAPIPREERDGSAPIAHPRYLRPPRPLGGVGLVLERRLFARAAMAAMASGGGDPDVVLAHSATLPGGLLGRLRRAAFVVT